MAWAGCRCHHRRQRRPRPTRAFVGRSGVYVHATSARVRRGAQIRFSVFSRSSRGCHTCCVGLRASFGYDSASQQVSVTDALGNMSTTVFDPDGRTLATVNANGFRTTQVYDAIGELLAVVDARGNRNSMSHDGAGRQSGSVDPLGNRITLQYDAASRQTLRIDGRGLRTSYSYDAANRLTGQQYQDGTLALIVSVHVFSQPLSTACWAGALNASQGIPATKPTGLKTGVKGQARAAPSARSAKRRNACPPALRHGTGTPAPGLSAGPTTETPMTIAACPSWRFHRGDSQPSADVQLGAGPLSDRSFPGWPRHRLRFAKPPNHFLGPHEQEAARVDNDVVTAAIELLDRHDLVAEPPDLRHLQLAIDPRPVNLWR
jgi:YD repeat-containing protein